VLVTGAAGQVGVDLVDTLGGSVPPGADPSFQPDGLLVGLEEFAVFALTRHELDITNREAARSVIATIRPDVIVHLAAYTQVDRAESDQATCFAVNAQATETMSLVAHDLNAHLITISTDYVFDGTKGSAYREDDTANPLNVYGASKRAGELLCVSDDTIVRASWVMGVRGKNVLHVIADRALKGEMVRFVNDQVGTVTLASDMARALVTMVRERPGGYWHVANTGTTSWFDVARYAGQLLGRGEEFVTPCRTSELVPAPAAARPARSDLDTTKWSEQWTALPEWREGVARLVRDRAQRDGESS
jgi:dTDP-4-dehydrorhamnose reductase